MIGKLFGNFLRLLGVLMIALVIISVIAFSLDKHNMYMYNTDIDLVAINFRRMMSLLFGSFLLYLGKQITSRVRAKELLKDPRPPVVYLRPFKKDESMFKQVFSVVFLNIKLAYGFRSFEENLSRAVEPIGPMIAIGKPGEKLPKPGAIRVYSDDDEWQKVVKDWLSKAGLVILRPGITEGLWWELEQAVASIDPEKFLILLSGIKRKEYEPFAKLIKERLSIELPAFKELVKKCNKIVFSQFNSNWEAQSIPLKNPPFLRYSNFNGLQRVFHYTLQPIFKRLGVEWKRSPYSLFKIFFLIALILVFLAILLIILL